jgi:hypothetical protein
MPDNSGTFTTIADFIKLNSHQDRGDLILEVDVEGVEWKIAIPRFFDRRLTTYTLREQLGRLGMFDGISLPDTLEMTCVRRADHQFEECRRIFPT